jgi:hypothetical protein
VSNWQPIAKAPKGIGPLLLRVGSGSLDPAFVGYQDDDGRWVTSPGVQIAPAPRYFCLIPQFDCDEAA